MKTVRWGIVSTAHINRRVIPMIQKSRRGTLVAVASRNLKKGEAYAAQWNIPRTFGSYEDLLLSDEIDALYISLPNHLHAEWTVRALRAGKHVLCEKPFAITPGEVRQMIDAARETGKVVQEAFMYRHHPQTKLVGEWVAGGRLGEISLVQGSFSFAMQNPHDNVRMVPEYGGGALWDIGIYPLSFAQYVYGRPPQTVSAVQWVGPSGVDESFAGQMDYGSGQAAQISGSFRTSHGAAMAIHGTLGRIEITRPFTYMNEKDSRLTFVELDGKRQQIAVPRLDPYLGEIENMQSAILDGAPTLVTLTESLNHVRTAVALLQAAQSGRTTRVE